MLSLRKIPTLARAVHPEENHRLGRGARRRRGGRRRAISERRERRAVRGLGVFETARAGAAGPLRAESLAKTVAKDRNPIEPSREPTRSSSASLASPGSRGLRAPESVRRGGRRAAQREAARRRLLGKTRPRARADSIQSVPRARAGEPLGAGARNRAAPRPPARAARTARRSATCPTTTGTGTSDDASPASTASVDGDAREKREAMPRYAAALASGFGGGRDSKRSHIRTELLPPARPVSARRSPPRRRDVTPPFADPEHRLSRDFTPATSPGTSTREKLSATPAGIKARYEAARLEEERVRGADEDAAAQGARGKRARGGGGGGGGRRLSSRPPPTPPVVPLAGRHRGESG